MILPLHIIFSLTSLAYTGALFISPSKSKLHISYALVAATLITGSLLVLTQPVPLTTTCETGLAYLAAVSIGIIAAKHKLASRANRI